MTDSEFAGQIVAMTDTLYRVSYAYLREKCDREDAVQGCVEKAWRKRTALRDERYMKTWVIRILINECLNILRRNKRETPLDRLPERAAPPGADAELHDALMRLPCALRAPVVLHYMENYDTREIAKMLRVPHGTVKTRMRRARTLLKDMLKEEPADDKST